MPYLRVLVVDDDSERLKSFLHRFRDPERYRVTVIDSAEGAIEALQTTEFDVISLDYDMGSGCSTGEAVVEHLCGRELSYKPQVIVHTVNPDAADRMVARLQAAGFRAGHKPFRF